MNNIKTAVLMALLSVILMVIGQYVGGNQGLVVMFIISSAINIFSYWNSDKLVLSAYNAQEINESSSHQLFDIVRQLAKKDNLPMPKVYIIESSSPNAFATGRNPEHAAVAITTGLLDMLTPEEVAGVLGHELTHVKHRDTLISTIAACMASAIAMVANILQFTAIFGSRDREDNNPLAALAMIILAPLAASLIQMAISRSREYLADEGGAQLCGNPLALASALAKIDHYAKYGNLPHATNATAHMFIINPLSNVKDFASNLFSTHPRTEERIARLKAMVGHMK